MKGEGWEGGSPPPMRTKRISRVLSMIIIIYGLWYSGCDRHSAYIPYLALCVSAEKPSNTVSTYKGYVMIVLEE